MRERAGRDDLLVGQLKVLAAPVAFDLIECRLAVAAGLGACDGEVERHHERSVQVGTRRRVLWLVGAASGVVLGLVGRSEQTDLEATDDLVDLGLDAFGAFKVREVCLERASALALEQVGDPHLCSEPAPVLV